MKPSRRAVQMIEHTTSITSATLIALDMMPLARWRRSLQRFAADDGITVIFQTIAVTEEQISEWALPTRDPKRNSAADRKWPHEFACELDAIPPDDLRDVIEAAINLHLPQSRRSPRRASAKSSPSSSE